MMMLDRMKTGRFKVFRELNDWWEEFRLYHRRDGKVFAENEDLLAATRYACMSLRHARTKAAHDNFLGKLFIPKTGATSHDAKQTHPRNKAPEPRLPRSGCGRNRHWIVSDAKVWLTDEKGIKTGELRSLPEGVDPKILATRMLRSKIGVRRSDFNRPLRYNKTGWL